MRERERTVQFTLLRTGKRLFAGIAAEFSFSRVPSASIPNNGDIPAASFGAIPREGHGPAAAAVIVARDVSAPKRYESRLIIGSDVLTIYVVTLVILHFGLLVILVGTGSTSSLQVEPVSVHGETV